FISLWVVNGVGSAYPPRPAPPGGAGPRGRPPHLAHEHGDGAAIERLRPDIARLLSTADGAEGVRSFVERRDAVFTGH
ncbi:hypothetical protein AB0F30_25300, partial [Streptomyces sp. NPDC029006]|uniref:hypothetical protein n=1 Tax=Streptomyces sp. NPDC029006 TaxID=3155467 RepID=UPI003400F964